MRQHPKITFVLLRLDTTGGQRRSQMSFMSGNHTFNLPPLPIGRVRKGAFHLATVKRLGPFRSAPFIQGNHGFGYSQFLPSQSVIVFPIVTGIAQQTRYGDILNGLLHGGGKLRRILTGSPAHHRPGDQMRAMMAHQRQFGPAIAFKRSIAFAKNKITRSITGFQAGGVNAGGRQPVDQFQPSRPLENALLDAVKSPFFTSRCSAFWRVVK
jgi:hypothetical protein